MTQKLDHTRYSRQLALNEVGIAGQKKLSNARVLCIGAGGLGCPALTYLTVAGVGTIGIVEGDKVEASNLHRQTLYSDAEVGSLKADCAVDRLSKINPNISLIKYPIMLDTTNAFEIIEQFDIVIDGSDNYYTRYLVNDVCYLLHKPHIYASIYQFEAQASLFSRDANTPCYRCLFPEPPPSTLMPNCSEAGVLGVLPGLVGTLQATEVIKLILGKGDNLAGRLLSYNALKMTFREFKTKKEAGCLLCGQKLDFSELPRFEQTCTLDVPYITHVELDELLSQDIKINVIDVRTSDEFESSHLSDLSIPLADLRSHMHHFDKKGKIVFYCQSGPRSIKAANLFLANDYENVFYLKDGMNTYLSSVKNPSKKKQ